VEAVRAAELVVLGEVRAAKVTERDADSDRPWKRVTMRQPLKRRLAMMRRPPIRRKLPLTQRQKRAQPNPRQRRQRRRAKRPPKTRVTASHSEPAQHWRARSLDNPSLAGGSGENATCGGSREALGIRSSREFCYAKRADYLSAAGPADAS